jgi:bacillithiol biosynthesis cysteine-adding enzyme BshC
LDLLMESSCLRHTELPHTTRLFSDFTYYFDRLRHFYGHDPHDPASYAAAAKEVRFPAERRAALVAALREQNPGNPSLDVLARPDVLAVVTGQQVGLFSGPVYTIYKALTAVRLARRLTGEGIPAVPVFWLATEDHDFAEVNHCWVFDAANEPVRIEVASAAPPNTPVGEIPVDGGSLEALRRCFADFPFGEEAFELARGAYAPGRTFGSAFAGILRRMFAPYGLLTLDPMQPAARRLAAPLLREALLAQGELIPELLARNRELIAAGYHAQVHVEEQTSLVFLLENGRRTVLHRQQGEYTANGRRFATEELAGRAEQLSPNALLRPVVQDFLLPTVAYVGGPAELAYLAQAQLIYRTLLGRMPVAVHRGSLTLLDERAGRLMDRYGLHLTDLFRGEEAVRELASQKLVPPALSTRIRETRHEADQLLEQLRAALLGFDPTLAAAFEKSRNKVLYQLSKIERKAGREALRRNEKAGRDAAYLSALVYPHKHLQERFYSILPFVARHGMDLIGRIYEEVRPDCPDHRLLVV